MDTRLTTDTEPVRTRGRLRFHPSRRGWGLLVVAGLLLSTVLVDTAIGLGRIESGVRVGDLELGGKRFGEAERLLVQRSKQLAEESAIFEAKGERLVVDPADVGYFPDVDATFARARAVGREGNPLGRGWTRLRAYFATTEVAWRSTLENEASTELIAGWAKRFDEPGNEAGIEVRNGRIAAVEPTPGRLLDRRAARRTLIAGIETWPREAVPLPFRTEGRRTDAADAADAVRRANQLIADPITLTTPSGSVELSTSELAELLEAVPVRRRGDWALDVRFAPEKVSEELGERMKSFEREPVNASFAVSGGSVSVRPGQDGLRFDAEKTAAALDEVASQSAPRSTEAAFSSTPPKLTTEAAEALNITQLVSTFTTNHPCCQPRVKNIHKIAATVDGMVVRPGETFSLNERVGKRTVEKGYVLAPMIFDGEFKDDVGGGVSQFATTMYNAIFFGGYDIVTAKAHSYYISRYPPGREATISWPAPDLKFRNDSRSGILIKTSYSNTAITVSFYGNKEGRRVTAETGERTNFTDPPVKREPNPALSPGAERVKQGGSRGFDITVTRVIERDGKVTRERIFTRYKAEPRIIEYGTGTPRPSSPAPDPQPTPPPPQPTPTQAPQGTPSS
ncbi:MAG TPA: VanW family protein [Actinomycetota bacterium]|nr:VanW family protein [Actinomycetota bacterium]